MLLKILSSVAFYKKKDPKEFTVLISLPSTKIEHKLHTHSVQREMDSLKLTLFKKFDLKKEELNRILLEYERISDLTGDHFIITKIIFLYTNGDGKAVMNRVTNNNWWKTIIEN